MRRSWLLVLLILTLCTCTVFFAACSYVDTIDGEQDGADESTKKPERTEFTVVVDNGKTVTRVSGKIGDTFTATASTLDNKLFLGWRYEGDMVSTDVSYEFTVNGDGALNAVYCNAYTVYLDAGEGTVGVSDVTVGEGQSYSLPVPTLTHYEFLGWYDGGTAYSDERGRGLGAYPAYQDIYLEAKWEKIPEFSITVNNGALNDKGLDTRTTETLVLYRGETVTLTAASVENMKFTAWVNSEEETVSTDKVYSFAATADGEYTARYKSSYRVIALNGFGGGEFEYFQEVTLSAQTNARGQKFVGWRNYETGEMIEDEEILNEDGEKIGGIKNNADGSLTLNVTDSVMLEAVYEKINYATEYYINDRLLSAKADYVLDEADPIKKQAYIDYYSRFDGTAHYNDTLDLPEYSIADDPYYDGNTDDLVFGGWTDAPVKMPADDVKIHGTVEKASYKIRVVNGTGGGVFESGATIVLTPKNSDGKRFVGWTVDGIPVSDGETDENNALTITVNRNATYVAVFEDTAD